MRRNKGFTLIELMIVLVVVGVLAAMIMFSSNEAIDMAKTTKLISDLNMLKKAALSFRADHYDEIYVNPEFKIGGEKNPNRQKIFDYLSNGNKKDMPDLECFDFIVIRNSIYSTYEWYVSYTSSELARRPGIRRRLEERAKSQRLYKGEDLFNTGAGPLTFDVYVKTDYATFERDYRYKADTTNPNKVVMRIM